MTERQPGVGLQSVDIVRMLDNPAFLEDVDALNASLAAFSTEAAVTEAEVAEIEQLPDDADESAKNKQAAIIADQELAEAENDAIDTFNNKYFGQDWLGRDIHATVAYHNDAGELGIQSLRGTFIGALPVETADNMLIDHETGMYASDMGYRALNLWFEDETRYYYAPLDKNQLLECTVEVPERIIDVSQPLCVAQCGGEILTHAITTSHFLSHSLVVQRQQIYAAIAEIEGEWEPCKTDNVLYTITANQSGGIISYQANRISVYLPGILEREAPYREVGDYENGPELWVEMTLNDGDEHRVPLKDVMAVTDERNANKTPLSEEELSRTNMLAIFTHDSQVVETLDNIEYALNYADDFVQDEIITDGADDLYELLPIDFFDTTMQIRGNVFHIIPGGKTKMAIGSYDNAKVLGFDRIAVSGSWRVACKVAIDADHPETSAVVYVVPTEEFLTQFDAIEPSSVDRDEAYDAAIVHEFKDAAEYTKKLVRSRRFKRSRLHQQISMLHDVTEPLQEMITDMIDWAPSPSRISCATDEYFVYGFDEIKTFAEIAANNHMGIKNRTSELLFQIEGDEARVAIPELLDDRDTHINGAEDFPLSGGQPMLMISNKQKKQIYLIPGSKIASLATVTSINNDN